jgi:hypothetical protein
MHTPSNAEIMPMPMVIQQTILLLCRTRVLARRPAISEEMLVSNPLGIGSGNSLVLMAWPPRIAPQPPHLMLDWGIRKRGMAGLERTGQGKIEHAFRPL